MSTEGGWTGYKYKIPRCIPPHLTDLNSPVFVLVLGGLAAAAAVFVDIDIKKRDEGLQSGMGCYGPRGIDKRCPTLNQGLVSRGMYLHS